MLVVLVWCSSTQSATPQCLLPCYSLVDIEAIQTSSFWLENAAQNCTQTANVYILIALDALFPSIGIGIGIGIKTIVNLR